MSTSKCKVLGFIHADGAQLQVKWPYQTRHRKDASTGKDGIPSISSLSLPSSLKIELGVRVRKIYIQFCPLKLFLKHKCQVSSGLQVSSAVSSSQNVAERRHLFVGQSYLIANKHQTVG
jgi:hypothetical protein